MLSLMPSLVLLLHVIQLSRCCEGLLCVELDGSC